MKVTFFLTENLFAVIGTVLAGIIRKPGGTSKTSQYILLSAAILRTALVPLIMMCNLAPNNRSHDVSGA